MNVVRIANQMHNVAELHGHVGIRDGQLIGAFDARANHIPAFKPWDVANFQTLHIGIGDAHI